MQKKGLKVCAMLILGLFAAATHAKPDEATEAQVRGCQRIGMVSADSGYGKNLGWQSIAKTRAENKAGTLGATHIVWAAMRPIGAFNGEAKANAYFCTR